MRKVKLTATTNQELFDNALLGVRSQGCASIANNEPSQCCYNGGADIACGVGWSIPVDDRDYLDNAEKILDADNIQICSDPGVTGLVDADLLDIGDIDFSLLTSLQSAHDDAHLATVNPITNSDNFMDIYNNNMRELADAFGLHYTAE